MRARVNKDDIECVMRNLDNFLLRYDECKKECKNIPELEFIDKLSVFQIMMAR